MFTLLRGIVGRLPIHAPPMAATVRHLRAGKTHKGARARFRFDESNPKLIWRMRKGKNHFNLSKTNSRLKRLASPTVVSKADFSRINRLLGR